VIDVYRNSFFISAAKASARRRALEIARASSLAKIHVKARCDVTLSEIGPMCFLIEFVFDSACVARNFLRSSRRSDGVFVPIVDARYEYRGGDRKSIYVFGVFG